MRNDVWWSRIGGPGGTVPVRYCPYTLAPISSAPNPNFTRAQLGEAPVPRPASAQPLPDGWQWEPPGQGPKQPRHERQLPKRGTKERKSLFCSARVGVALYRALDGISEKAEIVDALYDALPDDVKERWGRDRDGRHVDQSGQYGIDGADWKLAALYHNWHRVDITEGIKNIIKNHIEDTIIGNVHKHMSCNIVNVFDKWGPDGQQWFFELWVSSQVDAVMKLLGLD